MREPFPSEEEFSPGSFKQTLEQDMYRIEQDFKSVYARGPYAAWELLDRLTEVCIGKKDEVA